MAILQKFTGSSPEITDFLDPMLVSGSTMAVLAQLVGFGTVVPVSEEILYRGFIFTALRHHIGMPGAALVTSLVFAALHFYGWIGLVNVFLGGLVLVYVFEHSGSLWPAVIVHAVNNITVTVATWYFFAG